MSWLWEEPGATWRTPTGRRRTCKCHTEKPRDPEGIWTVEPYCWEATVLTTAAVRHIWSGNTLLPWRETWQQHHTWVFWVLFTPETCGNYKLLSFSSLIVLKDSVWTCTAQIFIPQCSVTFESFWIWQKQISSSFSQSNRGFSRHIIVIHPEVAMLEAFGKVDKAHALYWWIIAAFLVVPTFGLL